MKYYKTRQPVYWSDEGKFWHMEETKEEINLEKDKKYMELNDKLFKIDGRRKEIAQLQDEMRDKLKIASLVNPHLAKFPWWMCYY